MAKSASRKYFTLGGCCSPESKIFLFGRVWQSCNNKASHRQINGSTEIILGVSFGGIVLFLPVKRQEAETIYRQKLGNIWKNISLWDSVVVLHWVQRWLTERHWLNWCYLLTLGGCVWLYIGNGLLGVSSSGSLYNNKRWATVLWPWPLMALMALLDLDRLDTSTTLPNNKWQIIHLRAFSEGCYCTICCFMLTHANWQGHRVF